MCVCCRHLDGEDETFVPFHPLQLNEKGSKLVRSFTLVCPSQDLLQSFLPLCLLRSPLSQFTLFLLSLSASSPFSHCPSGSTRVLPEGKSRLYRIPRGSPHSPRRIRGYGSGTSTCQTRTSISLLVDRL